MATETKSGLARQGYQGETSLSDTNYWIGYYKISYNSLYTVRFKVTPSSTWTNATFTITASEFEGGTKMNYYCKLSTSQSLQIPTTSDKAVTWSNKKATITFNQTFTAGTDYYLFVVGRSTGDYAVYKKCSASVTGTIYEVPDPTPTRVEEATVITSASNFTLDNAVTIKFTPKYSDYQYKLKYIISDASYTTGYITPNTTSQYTYSGYAPTLATFGNKFAATSTTATMTIELYTYLYINNSYSQVGTKQTKTCTATMPNNTDTQPTIGTFKANNPSPNINNNKHFHGVTVTPWEFATTLKFGATITSVVLKRGSTSVYTGNIGSGSVAVLDSTTGGTGSSGTYTVSYTLTVTDSRGFTKTSSTVTQTCYSYTAPQITSYSTVRCDSNGDETAAEVNLTSAKSKLTYTYSTPGGNTITVHTIQSRTPGGSWNNKGTFNLNSTANVTSSYNINNSYEFRYTLTDLVGKSAVQYDMLSPVYFIMDFGAGGKSIGMFGAAPTQRTTASIFEVFGDFVTGGRIILTSSNYGTSTSSVTNPTTGQLFFVKQT